MAIPQETVDNILGKCARHCCICRKFLPLHLHIHHIIEKNEGGTDELDNLIPVCEHCHSNVHTSPKMTRRFTQEELKIHRNNVFELVNKGKLPSNDTLISNNDLDYIINEILEKVNLNKEIKFDSKSLKVLYALLVEEKELFVQPILSHEEKVPVLDNALLIVGNQQFISEIDANGLPIALQLLLKEKLIEKTGLNQYKITYKGVTFCEEKFDTYGKYTLIKCKCLNCDLHFIICTWYPEKHNINAITCPECGKKNGKFLKWRENSFGFIFELVPGNSGLDIH